MAKVMYGANMEADQIKKSWKAGVKSEKKTSVYETSSKRGVPGLCFLLSINTEPDCLHNELKSAWVKPNAKSKSKYR